METQASPSTSLTPPVGPPAATRRGTLRVYLGATPGSGKTFAMLREGRDRRSQGEDVVIGFVETYGRPRTVEALDRLEVVPRLRVEYKGTVLEEMDLDAVLARRPQIALVDELAHTNAPGVRNAKRWQDVEELRDAGIDVITTVNVQHVESVKDVVEHITGIPVRETIPDEVLDRATEIQFIDIAPEALRKRMRHGNIYARDRVETALRNFFRPGNLSALREIALRLVAQTVGASRSEVRPSPEDVVVAVSGSAGSEMLIRRGARMARRLGGLCAVVTVIDPKHQPAAIADLERLRSLADQLHCAFIERYSNNIAASLVAATRELEADHLMLGESPTRQRLSRWRTTLVDRLIDELPDTNLHVIARFGVAHPPPDQVAGERPEPDALLRSLQQEQHRHGSLRIYLGYAHGCGTTSAMLDEARRRKSRGTDAIVAAIDMRGRGPCDIAVEGLEILGGLNSPGANGVLDVDALLARNPEVACIDDLAGVDTAGRTRYEDLHRLLDAGITVIATLHLADVRSTVEAMGSLLGEREGRRVVDDSVLTLANEMEIVDVTPSVIDQRLRRGEIMDSADAARALQGEFRPQVLAALRESAFRLIAEHTDRQLLAYMRERRIDAPWEVRQRVIVCVPPRPGMEDVIRRAKRRAANVDGEFTVLTVRTRPRSNEEKQLLGEYAALTHQMKGEFVTLYERSVAPAICEYARKVFATEIIVGGRRRRKRFRLLPSTLRQLIRILADVDVHILAADPG
jgi:two-component system sensor histidine kinase KdpD